MKKFFRVLWEKITDYIFVFIYVCFTVCCALPLGVLNYLIDKEDKTNDEQQWPRN